MRTRFRSLTLTAITAIVTLLAVVACGTTQRLVDIRAEETGGSIQRGEEIARMNGCMWCHTVDGNIGTSNGIGPDLNGWPETRLIAGQVENQPENLIQFLMNPQSVAPGSGMPSVGLTEDEARDVASWLYSLED